MRISNKAEQAIVEYSLNRIKHSLEKQKMEVLQNRMELAIIACMCICILSFEVAAFKLQSKMIE